MKEAKIKLSEQELLLVQDAAMILTKNAIIQKTISLFGILAQDMKAILEKATLPEEVMLTTPKISRGENYRGLPYVMLDYPRLFTQENIFAIRTMFWWGNYFSITLHLNGAYKAMYAARISQHISLLAKKHFSICISPDQWRHELEEGNFISLSSITEEKTHRLIQQNRFLKLSAKTEFTQWNDSAMILMELFTEIIQVLSPH